MPDMLSWLLTTGQHVLESSFIYRVGAEDDKHKKVVRVTRAKTKEEKRQKKVMDIVKKVISEQADKKNSHKSSKSSYVGSKSSQLSLRLFLAAQHHCHCGSLW